MKTIYTIVIGVILAVAAIELLNSQKTHEQIPAEIHEMYTQWKAQHGKKTATPSEHQYRLQVFFDNYRYVNEVNGRQSSFKLGLNQFADMSNDEIRAKYTGFVDPRKLASGKKFTPNKNADVNDEVDWRKRGAVGPVKNQKQCGSCWSFGATGVVESAHFIAYGESVILSEQQMMDCSWSYGNHGCNGGLPVFGFKYVKANGMTTLSQYPYLAKDGHCHYNSTMKATIISDYEEVVDDEEDLLYALQEMPAAIGIFADPIMRYKTGIFNDWEHCPPNKANHAVIVVGFGEDNGEKFWVIRNSWGTVWGEAGYIRVARRGSGPGICGIAQTAAIVVM